MKPSGENFPGGIFRSPFWSDVYTYYRALCPVCMREGKNVGSDVGGASQSIIIVAALLAHKLLLAKDWKLYADYSSAYVL